MLSRRGHLPLGGLPVGAGLLPPTPAVECPDAVGRQSLCCGAIQVLGAASGPPPRNRRRCPPNCSAASQQGLAHVPAKLPAAFSILAMHRAVSLWVVASGLQKRYPTFVRLLLAHFSAPASACILPVHAHLQSERSAHIPVPCSVVRASTQRLPCQHGNEGLRVWQGAVNAGRQQAAEPGALACLALRRAACEVGWIMYQCSNGARVCTGH